LNPTATSITQFNEIVGASIDCIVPSAIDATYILRLQTNTTSVRFVLSASDIVELRNLFAIEAKNNRPFFDDSDYLSVPAHHLNGNNP
jgi:hypothetical protein